MVKLLTAIGLMSGTSGDGIDASIIQSDGEEELNIIDNCYVPFNSKLKSEIRGLKEKIEKQSDLDLNLNHIVNLEQKITVLHSEAVEQIIKKGKVKKSEIDIIGFHGQTIYHNSKQCISKQLANGELLCELTKINVVFKFRDNDIKNGGQGAPLVPIFHHLIQKKKKIQLPVMFVNLGGISNITYIDSQNQIKSFDCGPGNFLIDKLLQKKTNNKIEFDINGVTAFKGSVNEVILESYLSDPFFELKPPKTLDVNDFSLSLIRGLDLENSVTTLSELTVRAISNSLNILTDKPKKIILCGGGRKNKYFFQRLKDLCKINILNIDEFKINGDFIESQAFGYLAIRSITNKPLTFPDTTGVTKASTGGVLIKTK